MTDCSIQIWTNTVNQAIEVQRILGIDSTMPIEYNSWIYKVIIDYNEEYFDFINKFMDILEPRLAALDAIGIDRSQISIWFEQDYKAQNNFEFEPSKLKRLGDNGIALCLSVY